MSEPGMTMRKPGQRKPPSEDAVAAFEAQAETVASKIPGETPAPVEPVEAVEAPAPEPKKSAQKPKLSVSRGGTIASPRERKDGTPTVSTTVTLPTDLASRLRIYNASHCPGRKQSDLICEAIEAWLRKAERNK